MTDLAVKTAAVIDDDPLRMACLRAVQTLNLPDWFIAAGFVRIATTAITYD